MEGRPARRQRAGASATQSPCPARVRCRDGRRDRAQPRDAGHAPTLSHPAVLRRRQGDQPRGYQAQPRKITRPFRRAPRERHRLYQSVLSRGAVADAARRQKSGRLELAGGGTRRYLRVRVRPAVGCIERIPGRRLAGHGQPEDRQPAVRPSLGADHLPQRP